jgi:hypothetical protein
VVTHIVIFSWIDQVTDDRLESFRQALIAMAEELSGIATIQHGADLHFRDGNFDYALVATFPDKEGWDAYQAHPNHKAFVRDFVTPIVASRFTIQF